jgi:hypothetical protein
VITYVKDGSELSPRTFTQYESGVVIDEDAGGKQQRLGEMAAVDYMAALRDMGWREARGSVEPSTHHTDPRHPALRTRPGESVWDVQERLRRADAERRNEASARRPARRPRERMSLPNVSSPYGAPMGRGRTMPKPGATPCVYLERVRINRGGYDSGGAYWGVGKPLYHAYDREGDVELFLRADDHKAAESEVRRLIPGALFARGKGCKR